MSSADVLAIVADAGSLTRPDRDVYGAAFVASGLAADGGIAQYSFISNQDARLKLGPGTQMDLVPNGTELSINVGSLKVPTIYMTQPACNAGQTCRWYVDSGFWFGVLPSASVSGCAAGTEGGLKANSSTHRLTYCDGTTAQEVPYRKSWSGALNFAAFAAPGCQTLTFTATGSARGEPVAVGGFDDVATGDDNLVGQAAISATDTAQVRLCCTSASCADLSSITFTLTALR